MFSLDQGCEWITTGIQDGSPSPYGHHRCETTDFSGWSDVFSDGDVPAYLGFADVQLPQKDTYGQINYYPFDINGPWGNNDFYVDEGMGDGLQPFRYNMYWEILTRYHL